MADLGAFAITRKWPAHHPDRIQLYSMPTPNGVKVSIMLEETGLAYEPHRVEFEHDDQLSPEFRSLNPNNKIPAIIDPVGPGGVPLPLFESGAILIYLADKSGQLLPRGACRALPMPAVAVLPGGRRGADVRPARLLPQIRRTRMGRQAARAIATPPRPAGCCACSIPHLAARAWMMGDEYTIADIAIFPMIRNLVAFYGAGELVGYQDFSNVQRALDSFLARPAVKRGLDIPKPA